MESGKNIVVYTILVGNNYDCLQQPRITSDKVDYICFVDKESNLTGKIGVWTIKQLSINLHDSIRLSRFYKIQPHLGLDYSYKYSLYIDANLIIADEYVYERIDQLILEGAICAFIKHPARDCAYQEAYNCIAGCKARWRDLLRQIIFLKRNKFPKHWGLYEANVIFREHNNKEVVALDELWWKIFKKYSKRDQLSLVYALWKTNPKIELFLPEGFSTSNHHSFIRLNHLPQPDSVAILFKKRIVALFLNRAKKQLKETNN